jgi:hypothetical protein
MPLITCQNGQIHRVDQLGEDGAEGYVTGLSELDRLLPHQRLARAAVHEVLTEPGEEPGLFFALLLAGAACGYRDDTCVAPHDGRRRRRPYIISDPQRQIYPPALAAIGFDLSGLLLLRPRTAAEELWAVTEALRCKGVGAVIAAMEKLTKIEARRLQLAAEQGGGIGILLRTAPAPSLSRDATHRGGDENRSDNEIRADNDNRFALSPRRVASRLGDDAVVRAKPVPSHLPERTYVETETADKQTSRRREGSTSPRPLVSLSPCLNSSSHAAATRWLVQPIPGERTVQRWRIQLIHGHGGRLFHPVVLERCRETHSVRTIEPMAHRPFAPAAGRIPA